MPAAAIPCIVAIAAHPRSRRGLRLDARDRVNLLAPPGAFAAEDKTQRVVRAGAEAVRGERLVEGPQRQKPVLALGGRELKSADRVRGRFDGGPSTRLVAVRCGNGDLDARHGPASLVAVHAHHSRRERFSPADRQTATEEECQPQGEHCRPAMDGDREQVYPLSLPNELAFRCKRSNKMR